MVSRIIRASALLGSGTKAESSNATANNPNGPSAMKKSERRVRPCVILGNNFNLRCLSIPALGRVIFWDRGRAGSPTDVFYLLGCSTRPQRAEGAEVFSRCFAIHFRASRSLRAGRPRSQQI